MNKADLFKLMTSVEGGPGSDEDDDSLDEDDDADEHGNLKDFIRYSDSEEEEDVEMRDGSWETASDAEDAEELDGDEAVADSKGSGTIHDSGLGEEPATDRKQSGHSRSRSNGQGWKQVETSTSYPFPGSSQFSPTVQQLLQDEDRESQAQAQLSNRPTTDNRRNPNNSRSNATGPARKPNRPVATDVSSTNTQISATKPQQSDRFKGRSSAGSHQERPKDGSEPEEIPPPPTDPKVPARKSRKVSPQPKEESELDPEEEPELEVATPPRKSRAPAKKPRKATPEPEPEEPELEEPEPEVEEVAPPPPRRRAPAKKPRKAEPEPELEEPESEVEEVAPPPPRRRAPAKKTRKADPEPDEESADDVQEVDPPPIRPKAPVKNSRKAQQRPEPELEESEEEERPARKAAVAKPKTSKTSSARRPRADSVQFEDPPRSKKNNGKAAAIDISTPTPAPRQAKRAPAAKPATKAGRRRAATPDKSESEGQESPDEAPKPKGRKTAVKVKSTTKTQAVDDGYDTDDRIMQRGRRLPREPEPTPTPGPSQSQRKQAKVRTRKAPVPSSRAVYRGVGNRARSKTPAPTTSSRKAQPAKQKGRPARNSGNSDEDEESGSEDEDDRKKKPSIETILRAAEFAIRDELIGRKRIRGRHNRQVIRLWEVPRDAIRIAMGIKNRPELYRLHKFLKRILISRGVSLLKCWSKQDAALMRRVVDEILRKVKPHYPSWNAGVARMATMLYLQDTRRTIRKKMNNYETEPMEFDRAPPRKKKWATEFDDEEMEEEEMEEEGMEEDELGPDGDMDADDEEEDQDPQEEEETRPARGSGNSRRQKQAPPRPQKEREKSAEDPPATPPAPPAKKTQKVVKSSTQRRQRAATPELIESGSDEFPEPVQTNKKSVPVARQAVKANKEKPAMQPPKSRKAAPAPKTQAKKKTLAKKSPVQHEEDYADGHVPPSSPPVRPSGAQSTAKKRQTSNVNSSGPIVKKVKVEASTPVLPVRRHIPSPIAVLRVEYTTDPDQFESVASFTLTLFKRNSLRSFIISIQNAVEEHIFTFDGYFAYLPIGSDPTMAWRILGDFQDIVEMFIEHGKKRGVYLTFLTIRAMREKWFRRLNYEQFEFRSYRIAIKEEQDIDDSNPSTADACYTEAELERLTYIVVFDDNDMERAIHPFDNKGNKLKPRLQVYRIQLKNELRKEGGPDRDLDIESIMERDRQLQLHPVQHIPGSAKATPSRSVTRSVTRSVLHSTRATPQPPVSQPQRPAKDLFSGRKPITNALSGSAPLPKIECFMPAPSAPLTSDKIPPGRVPEAASSHDEGGLYSSNTPPVTRTPMTDSQIEAIMRKSKGKDNSSYQLGGSWYRGRNRKERDSSMLLTAREMKQRDEEARIRVAKIKAQEATDLANRKAQEAADLAMEIDRDDDPMSDAFEYRMAYPATQELPPMPGSEYEPPPTFASSQRPPKPISHDTAKGSDGWVDLDEFDGPNDTVNQKEEQEPEAAVKSGAHESDHEEDVPYEDEKSSTATRLDGTGADTDAEEEDVLDPSVVAAFKKSFAHVPGIAEIDVATLSSEDWDMLLAKVAKFKRKSAKRKRGQDEQGEAPEGSKRSVKRRPPAQDDNTVSRNSPEPAQSRTQPKAKPKFNPEDMKVPVPEDSDVENYASSGPVRIETPSPAPPIRRNATSLTVKRGNAKVPQEKQRSDPTSNAGSGSRAGRKPMSDVSTADRNSRGGSTRVSHPFEDGRFDENGYEVEAPAEIGWQLQLFRNIPYANDEVDIPDNDESAQQDQASHPMGQQAKPSVRQARRITRNGRPALVTPVPSDNGQWDEVAPLKSIPDARLDQTSSRAAARRSGGEPVTHQPPLASKNPSEKSAELNQPPEPHRIVTRSATRTNTKMEAFENAKQEEAKRLAALSFPTERQIYDLLGYPKLGNHWNNIQKEAKRHIQEKLRTADPKELIDFNWQQFAYLKTCHMPAPRSRKKRGEETPQPAAPVPPALEDTPPPATQASRRGQGKGGKGSQRKPHPQDPPQSTSDCIRVEPRPQKRS
ncbi:hypothetical protein BJ508DRAFT_326419 [Ascobolus immersus RN42]|uniref:Uncharacterized protein n=1 Tax=Ascobolus immersus RN42 TaxID=1160509 RepID=A0A3N4IIQ1_ASCIM|nr:hypothetical protein BJ508DRAFT_326419 [Ascobolus immersus RN42]